LPGAPAVTFTTTAAQVTTVEVANSFFSPTPLTVPLNTVVTFAWQGTTLPHNVTFGTAGAPADIPNQTSGSFPRQFNTAGTFSYACTNHPPGMVGTITVTP
jgi:plastocyanin